MTEDKNKMTNEKNCLSKDQVENLYKLILGTIDDYDSCKMSFIRIGILNALKKCLKIAEIDHLARIGLLEKMAMPEKNPHNELNSVMKEFNFKELEPCHEPRVYNPECGKMTSVSTEEYDEIVNPSNESPCGDLSCIPEKNTEWDALKKKEPKKTKRAKKSSGKEEKSK